MAFLEVEGRTSHINPDRFCPFVSMDCKSTVIGNMLNMFLIMLFWNDKLNWLGMCVSKNNVQFCLVSTCWGLNWHSDSCFFDSEWECVCLYEREIISQSLACICMNLPYCSAQALTHHFNFILVHKRPNVYPLSLYLCISTHSHAHHPVATVTP